MQSIFKRLGVGREEVRDYKQNCINARLEPLREKKKKAIAQA